MSIMAMAPRTHSTGTRRFSIFPPINSLSIRGAARWRGRGWGGGEGFTVNIPLPAGCGDEEYLRVFKEIVAPVGEKFQPEWILVSAGFDPHRSDPLGAMNVTEQGFGAMAAMLLDLAERYAGGKIAFLLEGGYDLKALKNSVIAMLRRMKGE